MDYQTVDWKAHGVDPLALVPYMARLEDIARSFLSIKLGMSTEEEVLNKAASLGFSGSIREVIKAVSEEAASIRKFTQEEYKNSLN